ncbi:MAG: VOC family protein [Devosia sp.]
MSGLLGFEHVGMTSRDAEATIAFYCGLLGLSLVLRKSQPSGELLFLDAGGGMLEIMVPANADLNRSRDVLPTDAGMRHLTFAFADVDATFEKLEAAGVAVVERPRDAHNREMMHRVAFVRDPDGIIVELIQRAAGR